MKTAERYHHEQAFWDARMDRILNDPNYDYRNPRLGGFEALAEDITYLRSAVDFLGDLRGRRVLDLACGDGWIALSLAKSGAHAFGCDISPKQIEVGRRYARANGLEANVTLDTMICEELTYENESFDAVIMHAALHHCDIDRTTTQIHRVLKPGGKAVLFEDYAYHPLMNLYRRFTPHSHTETEEALTDDDLRLVVSKFSRHHLEYYGLLNLVETSRNRVARGLRPLLRRLDGLLLRAAPALRRHTKLVGIFLVK